MVTNYPQGLTVTRPVEDERVERQSTNFFAWLFGLVTQFLCGLRGHDEVLHFHDNRVQLQCTSCGYSSPGWEVGQRPPRVRYQGDARRHLMLTQVKRPVMVRKSA